jgi:hypothetical protein
MAGHRPGRAGQSGRLNARAAPRRHLRTNIGSPGLCDRALIGLTGHRRGARHEVEDVYTKKRGQLERGRALREILSMFKMGFTG